MKPVRIPRDVQVIRVRWGIDPLAPGWWTNGDVIAFVGEKVPRRPHRDYIEDLLLDVGPGYIERIKRDIAFEAARAVTEDIDRRTAFVQCPACYRRRWGGHCPTCISGPVPGVLKFGRAYYANNDCETELDIRYANLLSGLSVVRFGALPTDPLGGIDASGEVVVFVMPIAPDPAAPRSAA